MIENEETGVDTGYDNEMMMMINITMMGNDNVDDMMMTIM